MAQLGIYQTKLITNDWKKIEEQKLNLNGLDLDNIWQNIVVQIGNIKISEGNTLNEQIKADEEIDKILKKIALLEKKAIKEKQPKRKLALRQEIKLLKAQLQ